MCLESWGILVSKGGRWEWILGESKESLPYTKKKTQVSPQYIHKQIWKTRNICKRHEETCISENHMYCLNKLWDKHNKQIIVKSGMISSGTLLWSVNLEQKLSADYWWENIRVFQVEKTKEQSGKEIQEPLRDPSQFTWRSPDEAGWPYKGKSPLVGPEQEVLTLGCKSVRVGTWLWFYSLMPPHS